MDVLQFPIVPPLLNIFSFPPCSNPCSLFSFHISFSLCSPTNKSPSAFLTLILPHWLKFWRLPNIVVVLSNPQNGHQLLLRKVLEYKLCLSIMPLQYISPNPRFYFYFFWGWRAKGWQWFLILNMSETCIPLYKQVTARWFTVNN